MKYDLTKFERVRYTVADLKNRRAPFESWWSSIADFLLPYRLRLNVQDYNQGDRKNTRIYDNTAVLAVETYENGFMSAACNPALRWVTLTSKDKDRAEFGPHKRWFDRATDIVHGLMGSGNTYTALPTLFGNDAGFGTALMSLEERPTSQPVFHRVFQTGSFWVGRDQWGACNMVYREYRMTLRQLYEEFGDEADYSEHLEELMRLGNRWETWVDVAHIVMPNEDYSEEFPSSRRKKFSSCWWELGTSGERASYRPLADQRFLKEGGFDYFPYVCLSSDLSEGEVYGMDCPGMKSLGDNKGLQVYEKRVSQGLTKIVDPHWIATEGLVNLDTGFIPGRVSYVQGNVAERLQPAHNINPGFLGPAAEKENEIRLRIQSAFSTNVFQMLRYLDDKQRTATEIMERKAEGLNQLIKRYIRIQQEVLRPLVDFVFGIALKRNIGGLLNDVPPDLRGVEIDYEFNGILAQAQRASRVQPNLQLLQVAGEMAATYPQVWDKLDGDQAIDVLGTDIGVDATIIRSDEEASAIRADRSRQQQQAALTQAVPALAKSAKDLSQASLEGNNALARVVGAA